MENLPTPPGADAPVLPGAPVNPFAGGAGVGGIGGLRGLGGLGGMGGIGGLGGLGGLGGVRGGKLRERVEKKTLVEYALAFGRGSATDRLRELDSVRQHTPLPAEVSLLNLTPYRLNLHDSQTLLHLCGGLVGVRFSSTDLTALLGLSKRMVTCWAGLDAQHKSMGAGAKKLVLPASAPSSTPVSEGSSAVEGSAVESSVVAGVAVESSAVGGIGAEAESEDVAQVRAFHATADEYVLLLQELQRVLREKQAEIDPSSKRELRIDADPESKVGRKLPAWLSTLAEKHAAAGAAAAAAAAAATTADAAGTAGAAASGGAANGAAASAAPEVNRSQIRVGALSVFLSRCVTGEQACSQEEAEALSILVQASNDTHLSLSNTDLRPSQAHYPSHTPLYWAQRFYTFLSHMTELATAVRDETSLQQLASPKKSR
ncbi:hypothetical protein B484DRAFT_458719 [Ochromonadaceae sp. CCMP2298]|nr:hypothetical protein B484DRAFT_458719 [Ochromonadaceae sp. CCMP2298]